MTTKQEQEKTARKLVHYETWRAKVDQLEEEKNRLSWRAVCELKAGVALDKVMKTVNAADNAFDALTEYLEGHQADHSDLSAGGPSKALP